MPIIREGETYKKTHYGLTTASSSYFLSFTSKKRRIAPY